MHSGFSATPDSTFQRPKWTEEFTLISGEASPGRRKWEKMPTMSLISQNVQNPQQSKSAPAPNIKDEHPSHRPWVTACGHPQHIVSAPAPRTLTRWRGHQSRWSPGSRSHPLAGSQWRPRRWCPQAQPGWSRCSPHYFRIPRGSGGWRYCCWYHGGSPHRSPRLEDRDRTVIRGAQQVLHQGYVVADIDLSLQVESPSQAEITPAHAQLAESIAQV